MLLNIPTTQSASQATSPSRLDFNNEDQLYQLAQMQGGAIAESAYELSHPNTGILSTVGNAFKSAFKGFIDVISIPSEIIAGTISDKYTIGQAIEKHLAIDQAVFGDTPIFGNQGSQTTMQKIGGFIVRAPVDILLDPVTYLTFGAGSLSKVKTLTEAGVVATEQVAKEIAQQGLKGAEATIYQTQRLNQIAKETNQILERTSTLNKEGQQVLDDYANHIQQGNINSFYKNEAIKLVNKSADEFGKPTLNIEDALNQVKNSVKTGEFDKKILKQTIDAPLDMERAKIALGNLVSRKPSLYNELLDKGGMKFLGKTLLTSQRIDSAIKLIPMAHQIENLTSGLRNSTFLLSKEAKEYSKIERRFADKSKNMKNEAIKHIANIFTENRLTSVEADLVTAAIEVGKIPIDPKLRDIYLTSLGIDTAGTIVNGDAVAAAIREVQKIDKLNYKQAIAAGIALTKRENHMMHLNALKDIKPVYSNISPTVNLKNAKFATVQKFINTRTGESIVGKAEQFNLEKFNPEFALKVLNETMKKTEERYGIKMEDIQNESLDIQDKITDFFVKNSTKDFVAMISKAIPDSKADDIQSAARVFKESLPNLDFKKLKEARTMALNSAETGIGDILRTSTPAFKEAVKKLSQKNARIAEQVPQLGEKINDVLANASGYTRGDAFVLLHATEDELIDLSNALIVPETGIGDVAGVIGGEAKDILKKIKEVNKNYSDELLRSSIDKNTMADYMDKMVNEFNSNPVGVKHLLNALLGKDQKMSKLLLELSDKKKELLTKIDDTGELAMMDGKIYRSKEGEMFRAARPTIQEANAAGFHFETNALPIMVTSSINTIKATVSKEFIDDIAKNFGKLESEAPEGWREVSVSGLKDDPVNLSNWLTGKNGEKIVFHPEVAQRIEKFHASVINDEDINEVLKTFDKVTGIFKASVTSLFPAFHGRNAISNVLNSFLDIGYASVNPARHVMSSQIAKSAYRVNSLNKLIVKGDPNANFELMKELSKDAFTDRRGYTWSMGQIHQILKDKNIALGNQFGDHIEEYKHTSQEAVELMKEKLWGDEGLDLTGKVTKRLKTPLKTTGRGIQKSFDIGQKVGQAIEDHSRIIHFLENLDKTGDVNLAAERTKMFLFDYGDLSNFERTFMKRIIPFYTWMKKNVELQVKTLTTTPGRISQEIHAFNTLSSVMSEGNGLTDEEFDMLPEYMKGQFMITTSRSGERLHILTNLGSPLEAAFSSIQPKNILAAVNPFIKLPAELTTGYDTFRGGMMVDTNNARLLKNAPQAVKDLVGFTGYQYKDKNTGEMKQVYTALNPKMFFLIMNQPFGSRVFKQYLHTKDTAEENKALSQEETIRNIFGIQSEELDMEQLSTRAHKKRVKELQDLLEKSGVIYKMDKPIKSKTTVPLEENE